MFDSADWWDPDGFLFGLHELLNPLRVPYFVEAFSSAEVHSVLDLGCGGGFVAGALAEHGFEVTGLDPSPAAIEAAEARVPLAMFEVGDGAALPFPDGLFSGVVLSEVLEHTEHPAAVFAEAVRVLRPNGVLCVTGPNRTLVSRAALIWLAQDRPTRVLPRGLHAHGAFITPDELDDWGRAAGLRRTDLSGVGIAPKDLGGAARAMIGLRAGRSSFGDAGRATRLRAVRSTAVAYMATYQR